MNNNGNMGNRSSAHPKSDGTESSDTETQSLSITSKDEGISPEVFNDITALLLKGTTSSFPKEYVKYLEVPTLKMFPTHTLYSMKEWMTPNIRDQLDKDGLFPCFDHYNQPDQELHIDGPAPAKRNCYMCSQPQISNDK